MKRWLIIVLTVPFLICATTTSSTKVKFHKGSLSTAKERAAQEGKLYFVDFVASWCMPCRWMDETTFSDQRLARYIDQNYVAVKVDIDDFDGFAYKQMYNIKMLPSILVFNAKGKLLAQYEESLAPSAMLKILQQHNTPANRAVASSTTTMTPVHSPQPDSYGDEVIASTIPAPTTNLAATKPAVKDNAIKQNTTSVTRTNTYTTSTNPTADEGLFRFSVTRQASSGYSVQIGAFGQYGNVLREAEKLEKKFNQPVLVHISSLRGKTVYKVMLGEFNSRAAAKSWLSKMKSAGMQGIVKDLSTIR